MLTTALPQAALRRILDKTFTWYFRHGSASIRYPDGTECHYGPGFGGPTIQFTEWNDVQQIILNPSRGFGDGYTEGRIICSEEDLDRFVKIVAINRRTGPLSRRLHRMRPRPSNRQRRQRRNIGQHYDGTGPDYTWWHRTVLGPDYMYTCARFNSWPWGDELPDLDVLHKAQDAKILNIAAKLGLTRPLTQGERAANAKIRLVEVGVGWGYGAAFLAKTFGVRVLGITISEEQVPVAREIAEEMGVGDLVEIRLISYQDLAALVGMHCGTEYALFDGAYSIGMFEHVPHSEYKKYFQVVRSIIKPEARLVLHCITNQFGGPPDPFVVRRIFPGSRLGSIDQITAAAFAGGFWCGNYENIGQHYVPTLRFWIGNHRANREEIIRRLGEKFYRARLLWLIGSRWGFELGDLNLSQLVFTNGKPAFGTWPWDFCASLRKGPRAL